MIELLGYKIQRELRSRSSARVFLATQISTGRDVVAKIIDPEITAGEFDDEAFIRETAIVASLNHPHVIRIHDYGVQDGKPFVVMDYLRQGDLTHKLAKGLEVHELIRVMNQLSSALDYAHTKDVVHLDVKPGNILFSDQSVAVLSDFGIAEFQCGKNSAAERRTVLGTPAYMSPEQAMGREIDGRTDFYSLGVVFYQMLTGELPYRPDRGGNVALRQARDPVPQLPDQFSALQPIVDGCLAKAPEERFALGEDLRRALAEISMEGLIPKAVVRSEVVTTVEIHLIQPPPSEGSSKRSEIGGRRQTVTPRTLMSRGGLAILISVLILGGTWYLVDRAPGTANVLFSWLIPLNSPSVEEAWNAAEGLRSDSNQSLSAIVAGYSRVLEIAPEHVGAQAGLLSAVDAWKSDIRDALDAGDLALAEVKLNESFNLDSSDADLSVLFEDLADRRLAESLLEDARALLQRQGRDDVASSASAIQAYQEVVRLDPTNVEAPAELDRFAQYYADLASQDALAGDVTNAMANMGRASSANPEFTGLDGVREQIQQAATLQAEIDGLLQEASRLRALGSLIDPPESNAAERYQRVLATDPENAIATQGMSEIIAQVQRRFYDLIGLRGFVDIDRLIERAIAVGLGEASVAEFKSRYALERERVDRVETLIAGAEQLMGQGFITEPADNNAVATLREALRLDPGNRDAEQRLIESAERLALVAHEAHDVGLQTEARLYLELALTVRPDVGEWRQLRDQWVNDIKPDD